MNKNIVTTRYSEVQRAAVAFLNDLDSDGRLEDRLRRCLSLIEKLNIELISPRELLVTLLTLVIIDSERRDKYIKKLIEWRDNIKLKQDKGAAGGCFVRLGTASGVWSFTTRWLLCKQKNAWVLKAPGRVTVVGLAGTIGANIKTLKLSAADKRYLVKLYNDYDGKRRREAKLRGGAVLIDKKKKSCTYALMVKDGVVTPKDLYVLFWTYIHHPRVRAQAYLLQAEVVVANSTVVVQTISSMGLRYSKRYSTPTAWVMLMGAAIQDRLQRIANGDAGYGDDQIITRIMLRFYDPAGESDKPYESAMTPLPFTDSKGFTLKTTYSEYAKAYISDDD